MSIHEESDDRCGCLIIPSPLVSILNKIPLLDGHSFGLSITLSCGILTSQISCGRKTLGWEDPLEERMATHSSILAWRIPWTEEAGGLWSTGSWRVRHNSSELAHMHAARA